MNTDILYELYNKFPREVGRSRRIVYSMEQLIDYINRHNGKVDMVCTSLYGFDWINSNKPVYESAMVDKILFDFDPGKGYDPLYEARKLDLELDKVGIKRLRIMSGGGIHIIVYTKNYENLINPTMALKKAVEEISSITGILWDNVVGVNSAQHVRIVGTYNKGKGKYSIPLSDDDMWYSRSINDIYKMADKPVEFCEDMVIDSKTIDMKKFDSRLGVRRKYDDIATSCRIEQRDIDKSCMRVPSNASNRERYILISSLVEKGFSKPDIDAYLKCVLTSDKYEHVIRERQLDVIYDNAMVCYKCSRIKGMGLCKSTPDNPCPYELGGKQC